MISKGPPGCGFALSPLVGPAAAELLLLLWWQPLRLMMRARVRTDWQRRRATLDMLLLIS